MNLLTRLLNRQPAAERLDRWIQPRAVRTPALPPVADPDEGIVELDLREANPVVRRVAS